MLILLTERRTPLESLTFCFAQFALYIKRSLHHQRVSNTLSLLKLEQKARNKPTNIALREYRSIGIPYHLHYSTMTTVFLHYKQVLRGTFQYELNNFPSSNYNNSTVSLSLNIIPFIIVSLIFFNNSESLYSNFRHFHRYKFRLRKS